MHSNDFGNAVFYAIPICCFHLVDKSATKDTQAKGVEASGIQVSATPQRDLHQCQLPSQSLKRVKEETDWFSSDQYRMHEQQWYGSAEADEWVEVPEKELSASVPVKTEETASSSKGKSNAPASGSKGKGKQSGQRQWLVHGNTVGQSATRRMERGETTDHCATCWAMI